MAKLVSKTYGEALFSLALEKERSEAGASRELADQVIQLKEILQENAGFGVLMKHPGISKAEKLDVLQEVFQGKLSSELYEFLRLTVTKDRYGDLPDIFDYFIRKMKEYEKVGVVYVSTAKELTAPQKLQVETRVLETSHYESLEMHFAVEPELIGGMIIRIGDRVVDSSIRSKLNDLTKQLLQIQLG